MTPLTQQLLAAKQRRREALAKLPYPEKVRMVEQMRDAALRIRAAAEKAGLRR